jgi:hypothetical protein
MPPNRTNTYQKQFIRLALKRLPHHVALCIATKFHGHRSVTFLNTYAKKHIITNTKLKIFNADEQQQYQHAAQDANLWHGTGRYQHGQNEDIDVLKNIITSGALRPVEDAYAIFSGGEIMQSISLTRLRVIARCYADMHGNGLGEQNRYGDALTWVSYYYGLFYARLYGLHLPTLRRYYKTWHSLTHDDNGHNTWGKKVNKDSQDVWDSFGLGSDIPGNYPIIFGLKDIKDTVQLSRVFQDYEVRVRQTISLSNVTHIEVPQSKVKEVERLLTRHSCRIPVEPIELGEYIASQRPFSDLLGYT